MKSAYVLDILRTPIGKYGGMLASTRPDDLAAFTIQKLLERNPEIDPNQIEDVIFGAANQAGEDNRNVARMALLLAGLPVSIGGATVNRLCASGLQAIMDASRAIFSGEGQLYVAGGVESMSRAPFVIPKGIEPFTRKAEIFDTTLGWRFINQKLSKLYHPFSMGETAENVAEKWVVNRNDQDEFAWRSQRNYKKAFDAGKFRNELVPFPVTTKTESIIFEKDEQPRDTTVDKLNALKPAFREGGTVTAGNSSGINDGAAACFLAEENFAIQSNLKPIARVVSMAVAGVDPAYMGIGPVSATQKVLKRAGISINELGLVEINEAFASQSLACIRELGLDPEIVNVNGGAIALGHPLGCSGVRISATLIHEMQRRNVKYGLATMCVGVGQGAAVLFEKV